IEAVGAPTNGNLHQRIRPKECGQEQAFGGRTESQIVGDERERDRDRRAIEIIDERGKKEQTYDRPTSSVGNRISDHRMFSCIAYTKGSRRNKFTFCCRPPGPLARRGYAFYRREKKW